MLINRESDYALRILRTLADGEKHPVGDLCKNEDIPQQFCYKILKKLSDAGYVVSSRGVGGGCVLSADLKAITFLDLMKALDTDRFINACLKPGFVCEWKEKNCSVCTYHSYLAMVQRTIDNELASHTLYDMMMPQKKKAKTETKTASRKTKK